MAIRTIQITDTLETFRQQFNALTRDDFGDIDTLDPSLSASTVIGAVNELSAAVSSGQAFFVSDGSNVQQVAAGQTLLVNGTANQLQAVVSVPDTLTISLTDDVEISNNLSVLNDLVVSNNSTLGNVVISGNSITLNNSSNLDFGSQNLQTTGNLNVGVISCTSINSSGLIEGSSITTNGTLTTGNINLNATGKISFEGDTNDNFENTLYTVPPTADREILLPDISGTLITNNDIETVTSQMILNGTIVNDDIANSTIRAAKLNLASDTVTVDTLVANTITGTSTLAQLVVVTANNSTNETCYVTFVDGATGNQGIETDTDLQYNPFTNLLSTTATAARYADLAEKYISDEIYVPGIIVMFGGLQEVTIATEKTKAVAGVVSEKPAYLMNANQTDDRALSIALQGRVPCKVKGNIKKGDLIVVSDEPGVGTVDNDPKLGTVVGKALQNYNSQDVGVIEVVVGRL